MSSKEVSNVLYKMISPAYDILDKTYFKDAGRNPREVLRDMIPDKKCMILDMCCGTGSNGLGIAMKKPEATVVGLDRSKSMLGKAKEKARALGLGNVKFICRDACDTGLKAGMFDYIIIGLVLHECDQKLQKAILSEAYRLLKDDGRLVVLDWDRQTGLSSKLKFAPMYIVESIGTPKYFREYYYSDKASFFAGYGFEAENEVKCKYTFLMTLKKASQNETLML